MPDQVIQRNKRTGEMRVGDGVNWSPYKAGDGQPVSNSEPGNYLEGFLQSAGRTARDTGKGVVKGVLSSPMDLLNTLLHPVETVKNVASAAMNPMDTFRALGDPDTGGRAIGGILAGGAAPAVLPKIAQATRAVAGPAARVAESLPVVGRTVRAVNREIPNAMEGLRNVASGSRAPAPTPTPQRSSFVPPRDRTMNIERASPGSAEIPYRAGSGTSGRTNITDPSGTRVPGQTPSRPDTWMGGDRTTGSFSPTGRPDLFPGADTTNLNTLAAEGKLFGGGRQPSITSEAGQADIPGITIGEMPGPMNPSAVPMSRARQAAEALQRLQQQPDINPNIKILPRRDDMWGPGSTTKSGELSMAGPMAGEPGYIPTRGANPVYDPQTPTPYLREQLASATDPAERAFLAKALAQRSSIDRAKAAADAMSRLQGPQ